MPSAFSSEIKSSWDGVEAGATEFHFGSEFLFFVEVGLAPFPIFGLSLASGVLTGKGFLNLDVVALLLVVKTSVTPTERSSGEELAAAAPLAIPSLVDVEVAGFDGLELEGPGVGSSEEAPATHLRRIATWYLFQKEIDIQVKIFLRTFLLEPGSQNSNICRLVVA